MVIMDETIFQTIIEHATDGVVVTDVSDPDLPDGPQIIFVNDAYTVMTGYSKEEVIGKSPKILQGPETDRNELKNLSEALKSGRPGHAELINYKKSGEKFWTSISIFPVRVHSHDITHWVGIKRDITAKKKAMEELETTLQELHHRVKNNLAVISAMIELQSDEETNESLKNKLLVCTSRIKSIADVHELLYQAESLTHIDIQDGLKKLTRRIIQTFQPLKGIHTRLNITHMDSMNINQAIPFSLITNEVITNCAMHAFPGSEKGEIRINLSQNPENSEVTLRIRDNGRGLPKEFNPAKITSTGMQFITTLSSQLHGDFQYSNMKNGTEFKLRFLKKERRGAHSGYSITN